MPIEKVTCQKNWYNNLVSKTNEKTVLPDAIRSLLNTGGASCLEIGIGTSPFFAEKLASLFKTYSILEKENCAYQLPKNAQFIVGDWESFPVPNQYDAILASHVVYYFDDKKSAVKKMVDSLTDRGQLFLVVNGSDGDYGPLKLAFSEIVGHSYVFTYNTVKDIIKYCAYDEHSFTTTIPFETGEELFETLRLSFDQYPDEYEHYKDELIQYFERAIKDGQFKINQKVFVVRASS